MRSAWTAKLLLCAALILALLQISSAPKPVEILHLGHFYTPDTPIVFDVRALPSEGNRLLVVAALDETGNTARRSDEDLDEHSQVTRRIQWDTFEAGDYTLLARVYDGAGADCARSADYFSSCHAIAGDSHTLEILGPP